MSDYDFHILILADDAPQGVAIHEQLRLMPGVTLATHASGHAGFWQVLREFRPDCIIADLHQERFTALEALQLAQAHTPKTAFILVSNPDEADSMSRCWQKGAMSCVLKSRLEQLPELVNAAKQTILAAQRDQAEWQHLQERFRQAQKLEILRALTGGVAHDFNNLLTVIRGRTEILLSDPSLPEMASDSLRHIINAADRAANLTRQLVGFSRKRPAQTQPLNLSNSIQNLSKLLRQVIGEDLVLETQLESPALWIHADEGLIEQLILNLAVNARESLPQGGQLLLALRSVLPESRSSEPDQINSPCVRLQVGYKPRPVLDGTAPQPTSIALSPANRGGLGTAAIQTIVDQLGGRLTFSGVQASVTFVDFPLLPTPLASTIPGKLGKPLHGGSERLLLVEADPGLRRFMFLLLQRIGYRVHEVSNGLEAISMWKEKSGAFDLLITDVIMPCGITGWDLAAQLQESNPALRVVIISGHGCEAKERKARLESNPKLLRKPFTPESLAEAVRACLDAV